MKNYNQFVMALHLRVCMLFYEAMYDDAKVTIRRLRSTQFSIT